MTPEQMDKIIEALSAGGQQVITQGEMAMVIKGWSMIFFAALVLLCCLIAAGGLYRAWRREQADKPEGYISGENWAIALLIFGGLSVITIPILIPAGIGRIVSPTYYALLEILGAL